MCDKNSCKEQIITSVSNNFTLLNMANYVDLTADNLLEITDQLDDQTLLTYCQTNKDIAALCDHKVWLHRIFKHNLTPLLPQAVLYPSLKEFYLNIRKDALYQVRTHHEEYNKYVVATLQQMIDSPAPVDYYYTDVQDVYNIIKDSGDAKFISVTLLIYNKQYSISYTNSYANDNKFSSKPCFILSFEEILKFPDLEPRSLVMFNDDFPLNVTSKNLQEKRGGSGDYVLLRLRDVGPEQDINVIMRSFKWGFYDADAVESQLLVLLDGSLINPSDDNYYVVITSRAPSYYEYRGLNFDRRRGDKVDYFPVLLKYLQDYGTYYKLEDLPTLLRQLI